MRSMIHWEEPTEVGEDLGRSRQDYQTALRPRHQWRLGPHVGTGAGQQDDPAEASDRV